MTASKNVKIFGVGFGQKRILLIAIIVGSGLSGVVVFGLSENMKYRWANLDFRATYNGRSEHEANSQR